MRFSEGSIYHIYNRGNNRGRIFFKDANYRFFAEKVRKYIASNADLLAWCLMPNHFHFLIHANTLTVRVVKEGPPKIVAITEGIRILLSSYTKAIQKQEHLTGNLFQQKTKSKCVDDYATVAFHYIHQNPLKGDLVYRMEDWRWSSMQEYAGMGDINLCNRAAAFNYLEITPGRVLEESYEVLSDELVGRLF